MKKRNKKYAPQQQKINTTSVLKLKKSVLKSFNPNLDKVMDVYHLDTHYKLLNEFIQSENWKISENNLNSTLNVKGVKNLNWTYRKNKDKITIKINEYSDKLNLEFEYFENKKRKHFCEYNISNRGSEFLIERMEFLLIRYLNYKRFKNDYLNN